MFATRPGPPWPGPMMYIMSSWRSPDEAVPVDVEKVEARSWPSRRGFTSSVAGFEKGVVFEMVPRQKGSWRRASSRPSC